MSKYRSPFTQKCHMTTPFKKKGNWAAGYHTGEDWVADGDRTLVAPTSGTVSYVNGSGSYGNHLIIHTDDGNCILMAHMASLPCVKVGQRVKAGDKVVDAARRSTELGVIDTVETGDAVVFVETETGLLESSKPGYASVTFTTTVEAEKVDGGVKIGERIYSVGDEIDMRAGSSRLTVFVRSIDAQ